MTADRILSTVLVAGATTFFAGHGRVAADDAYSPIVEAVPADAEPEAAPTLIVYSVADLVVQPARTPLPTIATAVESSPYSANAADTSPSVQHRAVEGMSELSLLLQSVIHPDSWEMQGGPGRVTAHAGTFSLVVRQTPEVHAEIGELLGQLRRLQETSIPVDLEFYTVRQQPEPVLPDAAVKDASADLPAPAESSAAAIAASPLTPGSQDQPDKSLLEPLMMGGAVIGAPDELRAAANSQLFRCGGQRLHLQNGWPSTAGVVSCTATQSPGEQALRLHIQTDAAAGNLQNGLATVRLLPGQGALVPLAYNNELCIVLVTTAGSVVEVDTATDDAGQDSSVIATVHVEDILDQSFPVRTSPLRIPERLSPPEPLRSSDRFRDYEVVPTGYIDFTPKD